MKILIIGDSHGNIANLKHVLNFAIKINVGAVIHIGDWNNLKSWETVQSFNIKLYSVLGNADISPEIKNKLKENLFFEIDNKKIYLVHRLIKNDLNYLKSDITFTGHFHSQKIWDQNGIRIVRPGALENEINFVIYDTKTDKIEFISQ